MKYITFLLAFFFLFACNKRDSAQGIGAIKLGISTTQLEQTFPDAIKEHSQLYHLDSIIVSDDLIVGPARLEFLNDTLVYISAFGTEKLYEYFEGKYEKTNSKATFNSQYTEFKSSSEDIKCIFENIDSRSGIGIFFDNFVQTHY